jgi:hypothetical protein
LPLAAYSGQAPDAETKNRRQVMQPAVSKQQILWGNLLLWDKNGQAVTLFRQF